jgi:hypothetical protein
MALDLVWAGVLFVQNMSQRDLPRGAVRDRLDRDVRRPILVFELGWVVDGLSIMMYFVVAFVGLLVFIYAVGYMQGDVRVTWFFASLSVSSPGRC